MFRTDQVGSAPMRGESDDPNIGFAASITGNFSAAFAIVGPFLAWHEFDVAVRQWRDRETAMAGPAVPARVVQVEPIGGDRHPESATSVVLHFQPGPGTASCDVPIRVGGSPADMAAGDTVMVVPRALGCEHPLVLSELGSPLTTFVIATVLMIATLGAATLWWRLDGPAPGRGGRPARRPRIARVRF